MMRFRNMSLSGITWLVLVAVVAVNAKENCTVEMFKGHLRNLINETNSAWNQWRNQVSSVPPNAMAVDKLTSTLQRLNNTRSKAALFEALMFHMVYVANTAERLKSATNSNLSTFSSLFIQFRHLIRCSEYFKAPHGNMCHITHSAESEFKNLKQEKTSVPIRTYSYKLLINLKNLTNLLTIYL